MGTKVATAAGIAEAEGPPPGPPSRVADESDHSPNQAEILGHVGVTLILFTYPACQVASVETHRGELGHRNPFVIGPAPEIDGSQFPWLIPVTDSAICA